MSITADQPDRPTPVGDHPPLTASLTVARDGRLQCTLHPPDPDDDETTTCWLTAIQDAFVDAESMR
jgi:hypothetical protein